MLIRYKRSTAVVAHQTTIAPALTNVLNSSLMPSSEFVREMEGI